MKIVVVKSKLEKAIGDSLRFVSNKPSLPVLSNLLIKADKKNNKIVFKATDLEMGVEIGIGAKVEEGGGVLVNGRVLGDVVRSMTGDKVGIEKKGDKVEVAGSGQRVRVVTDDMGEYPVFEVPMDGNGISLSVDEVRRFLKKTAFSVSKDEIRPILTGLMIKGQEKGGVEVVSTDGVRLSVFRGSKIEWEGEKVVPVRFWNEVVTLFGDKVFLGFNDKKKQIVARGEEGEREVVIVSQLLEGDYPRYEGIIPKESRITVVVNRELFYQRLGVVMVLAREGGNVVKIRIDKDKVNLKAEASVRGQADAEIEAEINGEVGGLEIAINGRFLQEVLEVIEDEYVSFGIDDKLRPVLVRGVEKDDYLHVIMPINLSE